MHGVTIKKGYNVFTARYGINVSV